MVEQRIWQLLALGAGAAAAFAVRRAATTLWRAQRDDEPPSDPNAAGVGLRDAVIWAAAAGAGAAVGRIVAQRAVARAWESATGSPPPVTA
jgi:hypothetical protein